jgi:hypothetical protein
MTEIDDVQPVCSGSLLVSIPKAGTHMALKLYGRAGYLQLGWGEIESSALRTPRDELKQKVLRDPSVAPIVSRFRYVKPEVVVDLLAQQAMNEIGEHRPPTEPGLQAIWGEIRKLTSKSLFVPGLLVSTHVFPWTAARYRFLDGWGRTGAPAIVYNYRDPRAQMVSMIKFLADSDLVATHPIARVYRPILKELGSMDRMLSFAIADPCFPFREAYRQNRWMLHHPNVLKLRFEDLVGEEGGGSKERQDAAVESWARFLAVDVPVETLTDGLFGDTATFHKGRVDTWRDAFQEHHLREFERHFGDVLEAYGYAD